MVDILDKSSSKWNTKFTFREEILRLFVRYDGYNEDIVERYHWHMNFAYYKNKGYIPLKLEDHHYFSENSQFGTNIRQIKGGSIRALQENLQQLIQLVKVHLMPLLQEIKQADFYKRWIDDITINDDKVQELKSKGVPNDDPELKKYRLARNEAVNHLKDKWISEVDGGRLWQMNRPQTEQGLDFALLPQLFIGINLDDPFQKKKTLKEQLDEDIYDVDVSLGAKEQVARFMYRFYTWLPTAVKDTQTTFSIKIAALKQFYSQIQMYIEFMKPLLHEINNKRESLEHDNLYKGFENENAQIVNLLDYSYSYIKVLGICGCLGNDKPYTIKDLEITPYGYYLHGREISCGPHKGKGGYVTEEKDKSYRMVVSPKNISSKEDLKDKEVVWVHRDHIAIYPIIEKAFSQKRRGQNLQTQQGIQNVPYSVNSIEYKARGWNLIEISMYREKLKEDNLSLLEGFISEISVVKDDLLKYVREFEGEEETHEHHEEHATTKVKSNTDFSLVTAPFSALKSLFSFSLSKKSVDQHYYLGDIKKKSLKDHSQLLRAAEDCYKLYNVNKIVMRFIKY